MNHPARGEIARKPTRSRANASRLRIRVFANFFKSYMSVSTIVAAAVPIPVASLKLIPAYSEQRGFLTVYSSLLCFLLLAFLFSIRHRLSRVMFTAGRRSALLAVVPLSCILLTVGCIWGYHVTLQQSVAQFRLMGVNATSAEILKAADYSEIPYASRLCVLYLGIFLFAETAFVLMALREYLQDVLRLDEISLLRGDAGLAERRAAPEHVDQGGRSM